MPRKVWVIHRSVLSAGEVAFIEPGSPLTTASSKAQPQRDLFGLLFLSLFSSVLVPLSFSFPIYVLEHESDLISGALETWILGKQQSSEKSLCGMVSFVVFILGGGFVCVNHTYSSKLRWL